MLRDYENMAVLIDFDGTITDRDTNELLFEEVAAERINKLAEEYSQGKHGKLELVRLMFKEIRLTEEEYISYVLDNFKLTEGFKDFCQNLRSKEIPFAIVSGGFTNGILPFLDKYGLEDLEVYGNRLIFNDRDIDVEFYDGDNLNCCDNAPCGNCKIQRYKEFKEKRKNIVFIGDGHTDRWVSNVAELVFAKGELVEYCKKDGVSYMDWQDFNDINEKIFL